MKAPGRRIFLGTVGSTAYGLAREGSDVDHLGIYVVPTEDLWSFGWGNHLETWTNSGPDNTNDTTMHEVGKYCRLAIKCNPSIMELLYLDEDFIEIDSDEYWALRRIRKCFLSERLVRDAYGGYAMQQIERLKRRHAEGKDSFSSDTAKRTAKHARHCFRLLRQGRELLETGNLTVKVDDPEFFWAFDDMSVEEIVDRFELADQGFRRAESVIPTSPDTDTIQSYLNTVRRKHL